MYKYMNMNMIFKFMIMIGPMSDIHILNSEF